ncbi:hypothetical protein O3G_MSEX007234 [Manduca sexta]|uniref:Uncharacterized protein n=1 Tax=Manduca sexta TaxID=7130 RepID=A0A922CLL7_MANSE|nr:hypothetical protein O3G_MSEX007234 [Manduca sexta]
MWWVVCVVSLVTVGAAAQFHHHGGYDGQDRDHFLDDEAPAPTSDSSPYALTRVRRSMDGDVRTLDPDEIDDVQGAIQQLLSGRNVDFAPTRSSSKYSMERNKKQDDTTGSAFDITVTTSHFTSASMNMERDWLRESEILRQRRIGASTDQSTANTTATEESTTTTVATTTIPKFDIDALLAIVANLTYDYDTNLTHELNETLQRYSIPTCATPTTTTTTTASTVTTEKWYSTMVVAKCFVCGMDASGIPQDAYCADAFATDFLPLVPVDARAKGHIARFRKYCRYFDVNNFQLNHSDPRAVLGRWTGGCAVRWIDLSGVYTQRTCRNRVRPATGRHYGSKRMAKLELTLSNMDDGCIISPMATLVPLSRGVSLYARFHACVCTGNWCNKAVVKQQWTGWSWLLLVVVDILR